MLFSFRMSLMALDYHHANSSLVYIGTEHRSSGRTTCSRPGFVRKYVKVVVLLNVPSTQPTQLLPTETGPVSPVITLTM